MEQAFTFILGLLGELLISVNNIPFIFGYTLLQFLVAGSFLVLLWQLIIYIFSRSSGPVRGMFHSSSAQKQRTEQKYAKIFENHRKGLPK